MRASRAREVINESGRGKSELGRETAGYKSGQLKLGGLMRRLLAVLAVGAVVITTQVVSADEI